MNATFLSADSTGNYVIGTTVSHYKILSHLGKGGMGVVYEAVDTDIDREVALKFLPPSASRNPAAKQRFMREDISCQTELHRDNPAETV